MKEMIPKDAKEYYQSLAERELPLFTLKDKWCLSLIHENNRLKQELRDQQVAYRALMRSVKDV